MKFLSRGHDGGSDSGVTGFWLIELKSLFSIVLLKFNKGTREAYHSHAFNAVTWWLRGSVTEHHLDGTSIVWKPSWFPKFTKRSCAHKIFADEVSYALSIRGPWTDTWYEWKNGSRVALAKGRVVKTIEEYKNEQH